MFYMREYKVKVRDRLGRGRYAKGKGSLNT